MRKAKKLKVFMKKLKIVTGLIWSEVLYKGWINNASTGQAGQEQIQ